MNDTNDTRGIHRRETRAQEALDALAKGLRSHGMMGSAVGLVLACLAMAPVVPGSIVLVAVALLFLMPVGGGQRGPRMYASIWLAALGLGWGVTAALAMHTHPPLVAIACMVGAWLSMLPSLTHVPTASAIWTGLCLAPPVVASMSAYDDVAGVGAALVLIGAAGHGLASAMRRTARSMGELAYEKRELEEAAVWLQGRAAAAEARAEG